MYGVPTTLDLSFLLGSTLIRIHLTLHQIDFVFDPESTIVVWGHWQVFGPEGVEVDHASSLPRLEPYHFHWLIGQRVVDCQLSAPESISIRFENGSTLRLTDSSTQYESFTIDPVGLIV